MIALVLLLQGLSPPPPPPFPGEAAVEWTCRLVTPRGARSVVRGRFDAVPAQKPSFSTLVMTKVTVSSDSGGRLAGRYDAGLLYERGRQYVFAVGPQKTLHVGFDYDPKSRTAKMDVKRSGPDIPGRREPIASGDCDAAPGRPLRGRR